MIMTFISIVNVNMLYRIYYIMDERFKTNRIIIIEIHIEIHNAFL